MALAALLVLIGWLAWRPGDGQITLHHVDKLQHAAAFCVLAVVASAGWGPGVRASVLITAGLLLYGAGIEVMQAWLPTREGSWLDWLADAVGIGLGWALLAVLRPRAPPVDGRQG